MDPKFRYRPGIKTSSGAGKRSGGIHERGIIASATREAVAEIRRSSFDELVSASRKNTSDVVATTSVPAFNITPLRQRVTAARCPSQSLTKVDRSSEDSRTIPAGVPGASANWTSRLTSVTPHPAANHGRAGRSSTREAPEIRKHRERDDGAGPRTERRVYAGCDAEQKSASPVPAGAE